MKKDTPPAPQGKPCSVSPVVRTGDEIIFKFEGNLRARVEGYEVSGGTVRLEATASLRFTVPLSLVVAVEKE